MRRRTWWSGFALVAVLACLGWWATNQTWEGRPWLPGDGHAPTDGGREERAPIAQDAVLFGATQDGYRVTLHGYILPGDEVRNELRKHVREALPDGVILEDLKVSASAPTVPRETVAFALTQLERLRIGRVEVRRTAITISGQPRDAEAHKILMAALATAPAGYALDVAGLVPPLVRPLTWSAAAGNDEIALVGHVPSEEALKELRQAARQLFPEKRLVDQLQLATDQALDSSTGPRPGLSGVADGRFGRKARLALEQLAELRLGTVELVGETINIRGEVADRETAAEVKAAFAQRLQTWRLGTVDIAVKPPSPYIFKARREAGTLTLTGYVPDEPAFAALEQVIRKHFLTEEIIDKLRFGEGPPRGYLAAARFGLEQLSHLASGELVLSDTAVQLSGESLYEQAAEQTVRRVSAVALPGWTGRADIKVRSSQQHAE